MSTPENEKKQVAWDKFPPLCGTGAQYVLDTWFVTSSIQEWDGFGELKMSMKVEHSVWEKVSEGEIWNMSRSQLMQGCE